MKSSFTMNEHGRDCVGMAQTSEARREIRMVTVTWVVSLVLRALPGFASDAADVDQNHARWLTEGFNSTCFSTHLDRLLQLKALSTIDL